MNVDISNFKISEDISLKSVVFGSWMSYNIDGGYSDPGVNTEL